MSFKFGLGGVRKGLTSEPKKNTGKPISAFGADEDEEGSGFPKSSKDTKKSKPKISQYGDLSTQQTYRKNADNALEVDSSIYDYDSAWDAMKARDEAKKAADKEKADQGKAKYMENLLKARDVREKDYLRAKEKKYQRDRETEGDEYADKEKFVTGAYKKQQEELRQQEELEKLREAAEMKRREKDGKNVFMNQLLEQGDRKHMEDVTAAAQGIESNVKPKSELYQRKTEADIAKELNSKGADITFTDDGEVADKRQLLSAGLNVMAKPRAKPSFEAQKNPFGKSGVSSAKIGNSKEARERQSRMLEDQLEQMMKRQADEESEEQREQEHAAKSRKTAADKLSARERYLQRKQAAAQATSTTKEANIEPPT